MLADCTLERGCTIFIAFIIIAISALCMVVFFFFRNRDLCCLQQAKGFAEIQPVLQFNNPCENHQWWAEHLQLGSQLAGAYDRSLSEREHVGECHLQSWNDKWYGISLQDYYSVYILHSFKRSAIFSLFVTIRMHKNCSEPEHENVRIFIIYKW